MYQYLELYLTDLDVSACAIDTKEKYNRHILRFVKFIEFDECQGLPLAEQLRLFLRTLPVRDQTKASYYRSIRAFINWCADPDHDYLEPLPKRFRMRFEPADPRIPLEKELLVKLLNTMPTRTLTERRNKALLRFVYYTGCRLGEAIRLPQEAVDLKRRYVIIYAPKTNKKRAIPLVDPNVSNLTGWLGHIDGPWLFPATHRHGVEADRPVTKRTVQAAWREYQERQGIERRRILTIHDLRRSFATHAKEGGMDALDIKNILGHSDLRMTEQYTLVDLRGMRDRMNSPWNQQPNRGWV